MEQRKLSQCWRGELRLEDREREASQQGIHPAQQPTVHIPITNTKWVAGYAPDW